MLFKDSPDESAATVVILIDFVDDPSCISKVILLPGAQNPSSTTLLTAFRFTVVQGSPQVK